MLAANSEHDAAPIAEESHSLRVNPRKTQCQVEGCRIALPKRKAYHKRYRICSYHATLSQLVLEGRHMRFCQQCGRFQLLAEFEGDKRSCRAKLDLHNVRRKQAREAAIRRSSVDSSPPRKLHNPANATRMNSITRFSNSSDYDYDDEEEDAEAEGEEGEPCSSGGGSRPGVAAAGGAALAAANGIRHDHDIDELLKDLLEDNIQQIQARNALEKHATDELLQHIINDPILPLDLEIAAGASNESMHHYPPQHHQQQVQQQQQQQHASPHQEHLAPNFASAVPARHYPALLTQVHAAQQQQIQTQQGFTSYTIAEELLSTHNHTNPPVSYEAPFDLVRVSFKLFNVHPSELPECVANEVQAILHASTYSMQNARIGCTHLSIEALLSHQERAALETRGSLGLLNEAIARGESFFPRHTFEGPNGKLVAQFGSEVSLKTGASAPVTVRMLSGSSTALCFVNRVVPMAVDPNTAARFKLYGSNISNSQDMVVCRQGSNVPDLEVLGPCTAPHEEGFVPGSGTGVVEFVLPRPTEGLHLVEVQRGSLLSTSTVPFLVIDNVDAVRELRQLEYDTSGVGNEQSVAAFIKNVGVVLDWNKVHAGDGASASADPSSSNSTASISTTTTNTDAQKRISELAQRVAATCIVRGWTALLRLVLPVIVPPGADPATTIEEFKSYSKQGLSMLHLAALSRCAEVVNVLAAWASDIGYTWRCEAASTASGLTPLHLACLIADQGVMASVLTSIYPEGMKLWTTMFTSDQARPIDFAVCANNSHVLQWLKKQGVVADHRAGGSSGVTTAGAGAEMAGSAGNSKGDDGASGSPIRLSKDTTARVDDDTMPLPKSDAPQSETIKDPLYPTYQMLLRRQKRRGSGGRAELQELLRERKTSYLDTVCEEMKHVEEELKGLPHSTLAGCHGGGIYGGASCRSWQLLAKGALVVATAGAAVLAAYPKTIS